MSTPNGAYTRTESFAPNSSAGSYPRFYLDPVQDEVASAQQGRPIFRQLERVEIILPGNPHTRPVANVTEEHRQRWPREYGAFREGVEVSPDGTPLEEWPILNRAQVAELKHLGIKTVEHVAALDDHAMQRIGMGGRVLRDKALAYLDDAANVAMNERLSKENDDLKARLSALENQNAELGQLMTQMHTEMQQFRNTPSAVATSIPGMTDPMATAGQAMQQLQATSSLDALAGGKRRARPAASEEAAA